MQSEPIVWFRGINTSDCNRKVSGFRQRLTGPAVADRDWRSYWIWSTEIKVMRDAFRMEQRTAGGVEKRLSWGLSLVQREEVAPLGPGTHTRTNILAHLIVKACLHFSISMSPQNARTPAAPALLNHFFSPQLQSKSSTNSHGFQSAIQTAQACNSTHSTSTLTCFS